MNNLEPDSSAPVGTNSKINNVESSLEDLKQSVDKIWRFLQDTTNQSPNSLDNHSEISVNRVSVTSLPGSRDRLESLDYPPLPKTQNDIDKSAPIMVVRKFRSSTRRLYKDPGRDIINQHILSEEMAERLAYEFIKRLGHVIQIKSVSDFTSAPTIRQASPLLYAVCCLHGLRFLKDPDLVNTTVHRQLYEEVREMLGQVVLASPIPLEELYALLIMSIFEAAPRPVFEYIESWLLSGICAQQAISTIDFVQVMTNLRLGKHEHRDKMSLSLWNNICLVNLRFAVGTGKPVTIPSELLDQCPAILNHPEATIDDGIVLAEILLFSVLCSKQETPLLDRHGHFHGLTEWEMRWKHLLSSQRSISLRFCLEFAYLVLAMRSVVRYRQSIQDQAPIKSSYRSSYDKVQSASGGLNKDHVDPDLPSEAFQEYAHEHALRLAGIFLEMRTDLVQELPKFHHICIAYCTLVLSEFIDKAGEEREEGFQILNDIVSHYYQFSNEIPAVMNVAIEKMKMGLKQDLASERLEPNQSDRPRPNHLVRNTSHDMRTQAVNSSASTSRPEADLPTDTVDFSRDFNMDDFGHDADMSFPTVEDFFGNWMMDFGTDYPADSMQG